MAHGGLAPQVRRKAAERLADLIDPDRALREAARLAYSDVRELFDAAGNLKPVKEWPDSLAAAVGSVEVVKRNVDSGDGKTDDVLKVRLWDKPKNLEMLFKHLGLLTERLEHTGGIEIRWRGEETPAVVVDAELTGNNAARALPEGPTSKQDNDLAGK